MKGVEPVLFKGKNIAIIFRRALPLSGVKFFTQEDNFFQVGLHQRAKGVKLAPHVHRMTRPINVTSIQEVLLVQDGKIRLTLYTPKGKKLMAKILQKGDSVLLMGAGHGVEFLAPTRLFEIKQGPYPGVTNAKIYFP